MSDWTPPYCALDTDLTCPSCGEESSVRVRELETVFDGDCVEAYCCECHVEMEVDASVDISYSDPKLSP